MHGNLDIVDFTCDGLVGGEEGELEDWRSVVPHDSMIKQVMLNRRFSTVSKIQEIC